MVPYICECESEPVSLSLHAEPLVHLYAQQGFSLSFTMTTADNKLMQQRKDFWSKQEATIVGMIQTEGYENMASDDADEIMAYLPDLKGKRVIDLAAGIGRFTGRLAKEAAQVTAVDVAESFIKENRSKNQHLRHVSYICNDVVNLDLPDGSLDVVFSSWLLKYLNEAELDRFLPKVLKWLSPGGYFFFRESCYRSVGTIHSDENPSIFRRPEDYVSHVLKARDAERSAFTLLRCKNILAYINYKNAANQVCFLAKKVSEGEVECLPEPRQHIVCPLGASLPDDGTRDALGGESSTKAFCARLGLRAGRRVLVVGCGEGESAEFLVSHYQVTAHGVDRCHSRVMAAIGRQMKLDDNIRQKLHFEGGCLTQLDRDDDSYDVIYCREALHLLPCKQEVFTKFYRWLRKGGILFITEYTSGSSAPSTDQATTCTHAHTLPACHLETPDALAMKLREVGFKGVTTKDLSQELTKILVKEQGDLGANGSDGNYKLVLAKKGQLTWTSFTATK
ncbi:uncharacterized protein LOC135102984 isoform X2 [Scylla paramamosain]|uniref:uncharacterized protein LOC135102984 isoform X2 n=1 Tax=Scylla paramamosain TaxID=85552 RepID=UPI003083DAAD